MEETTYLSDKGVLVTSTRVELGGQTFAVRNIGSVKVTQKGVSVMAVLVVIFGVLLLPGGLRRDSADVIIVGLMLIGGGVAWLRQRLSERTLVLVTGGGEIAAYKSHDASAVEAIRAAIANAISTR